MIKESYIYAVVNIKKFSRSVEEESTALTVVQINIKLIVEHEITRRKVAIITGASRGIGKGIAEVFAKHGANGFTYSSSVESALVLENELNSLVLKLKISIKCSRL
jgi:hypothetical protein